VHDACPLRKSSSGQKQTMSKNVCGGHTELANQAVPGAVPGRTRGRTRAYQGPYQGPYDMRSRSESYDDSLLAFLKLHVQCFVSSTQLLWKNYRWNVIQAMLQCRLSLLSESCLRNWSLSLSKDS